MKIKRESILKSIDLFKTKFDDNFNENTKIISRLDAHNTINTILAVSAEKEFEDVNKEKFEYNLYLDKNGKTKLASVVIIDNLDDLLNLISCIDITKIDINNFKSIEDGDGNNIFCYVQDIHFEYE